MARLDVLRAEVDLANSRARRIQVQANLDQAYQSLRTVLSLPQSQPLALRGTLDDLLVPESRDALSQALPNRPDLRAFESRREMAEYAVDLANAEWKPTLAFTGNVAYQDDSATTLLNWDNQNYQFGVAIRMPLFAAPGIGGAARRRQGPDAPGRARAERGPRRRPARAGDGVDRPAGGDRSRRHAAEGARPGARERDHRARCPTRTASSPRPSSTTPRWPCCRPTCCCSRPSTPASSPRRGPGSPPARRRAAAELKLRLGLRAAGRLGRHPLARPLLQRAVVALVAARRTRPTCRRGSGRRDARAPRSRRRCRSAPTPSAAGPAPGPSSTRRGRRRRRRSGSTIRSGGTAARRRGRRR